MINRVEKSNLGTPVSLKDLALLGRNVVYNPKRHPAAFVALARPRVTAIIWASGKMLLMGGRTEPDMRLANKKIAKMVQKYLEIKVRLKKAKLTNMVAQSEVGY